MDEFTLKGENGAFLRIAINRIFGFPDTTSHFGGYETESVVEINSGSFKVKSTMYSSTGEIFDFYNLLLKANQELEGSSFLRNYEDNIEVEVKYGLNGHVTITGTFRELSMFNNILNFEFSSDQSYIQSTLSELKSFVEKYGDNKGIITR